MIRDSYDAGRNVFDQKGVNRENKGCNRKINVAGQHLPADTFLPLSSAKCLAAMPDLLTFLTGTTKCAKLLIHSLRVGIQIRVVTRYRLFRECPFACNNNGDEKWHLVLKK